MSGATSGGTTDSTGTAGAAGGTGGAYDEARTQVTALVEDRLGVDVPSSDTDLVEAGLLDSLGLVTLIVALEDTFACELPLDDFDIARFASVDAIVAFLDGSGVLPS